MKHLVLRKRVVAGGKRSTESYFTEMVAASGSQGVQFPFEATTEDLGDRAAADLRRDPEIDDVILSIPFTLIAPMNEKAPEPLSEKSWGLEAVGALTSSKDGKGVTVAVLDTGVDVSHAAFSGRSFASTDLMDFTASEQGLEGAAPDYHGHGTHVAGTIFGGNVNGLRVGVAPKVSKALIGKVLGPEGASTEVLFNAIQWALNRRADIISMSLGMNFPGVVAQLVDIEKLPQDIAVSRALEAYRSNVRLFDRLAAFVEAAAIRGRGALLVAASGNESRRQENPQFTVAVAPPAAADGFMSVGAVSRTDNVPFPFAIAPFSNTGCLVSAPGVDIISAKLRGGLVTVSGTSMATPHVAGVMALWTQALFPEGDRPEGWARDIQRKVEQHVKPAPAKSRADFGIGVVQAPE